jgi:hypothetical protein
MEERLEQIKRYALAVEVIGLMRYLDDEGTCVQRNTWKQLLLV